MTESFLRDTGKNIRITYIPSEAAASRPWFQDFRKEHRRFGIKKVLWFAVDEPFARSAQKDALRSEVIFLSGGNTFYFLKQLRKAGMVTLLRDFVRKGGVLTGLSAGSIIMTPSIELAGLVKGEADLNEAELRNLKGLCLTPFEVYPHYTSSRRSVAVLKRRSRTAREPIYTIQDGSGIIVRDTSVEFTGTITCWWRGTEAPVSG